MNVSDRELVWHVRNCDCRIKQQHLICRTHKKILVTPDEDILQQHPLMPRNCTQHERRK